MEPITRHSSYQQDLDNIKSLSNDLNIENFNFQLSYNKTILSKEEIIGFLNNKQTTPKQYYYHKGMCPDLVLPESLKGVFDRSRSMFDIPQMEVLTPLGKLCQPKTIDQLFYERARQIIDLAGSKKIVVAWSGGIDSTSVLVEFLKLAPKSQLTVLMNRYSIEEYPEFYAKYIKDQIEVIDISQPGILRNCVKDGIIVTGATFDQTFGDETIHHPELSTTGLNKFLSHLNASTRECYAKSIEACPVKLTNVKEFFWWMYYTICYQNYETVWLSIEDCLIAEQNIFHFPSNQDWNDYSVSTPMDIKFPGYDYRNYKIALKNHIYEFNNDDYYRTYKVKFSSMVGILWQDRCHYITTDWQHGHAL